MRIVQIIDSLEIGGAEKMAVNYANALSEKLDFSGLVATRAEGNLKSQLNGSVSYLFLKKTKTLDFAAAFRLKKYCKAHQVTHLQPHSSSYFMAVLVKLIYPKIAIIWHDHNGLSEFISAQKSVVLKLASLFFKGIIVVNFKLKNWAEKELYCSKVVYLPNFTNDFSSAEPTTVLHGITGKRILCLANLRDQKNHFFLLDVAEKLKATEPEWTFHLVGKDFKDGYSRQLLALIAEKKLQNTVFIYGSRNDVFAIIDQCDIAILTSKSEGLPVALIEYGLHKKPVVTTNVGEIPLIVKNGENGFITGVKEVDVFCERLSQLIQEPVLRKQLGEALHQTIKEQNSEEAVIRQYLNWLKTL
ncbi:MAG: glycosyltransferase [Flavobacterium sp.]|uniref:glycosyltransferase n=1 Tax=Flavobacterium sp. TaxID=239 RepID=UPI00391D0BCC